MATKSSLTIRLTESVVFLRTADRTSRRHLVHGDSPPSMVRGLLTLELAKPTRISSIELDLQGKASNFWSEGVGSRRFEVTEHHKVFSAKTVYFSAASTHLARRTASVGPGIINHEEDHLDWEDSHNGDQHYDHDGDDEYDAVTPRNSLPSPTALVPQRVTRRASLDTLNSIFQREYVSHQEHIHPTPPLPNSAPPTSIGTSTSSCPYSPSQTETSRQSSPEHPRPLSASLVQSTTSSRSASADTPQNEPGPSRYSRPLTRKLLDPTRDQSTGSSSSRSRSSSQSRPPNRTNDPPDYHDDNNNGHPSTSAIQDTRGRRASRFSFGGISNALLGVISERGRSSSRNPDRTDSHNIAGDQKTARAARTRFGLGELLGFEGEEHKTSGDGWKEFKKGTYTYPISITIPGDSPPTIRCDFGSVTWRLKAHVHRPGPFRSKFTASRDVTVISYPVQDDTEEQSNIIIERQWEDQMQYLISVSGRMFHIGGIIPIQLTIMPLAKIKIHKLSVFIEERVDYYFQMKRIGRTDPINRIELLCVKHPGKELSPILPLGSNDVEALKNSPLFVLCNPDNSHDNYFLSEIASNLMGPGPWTFNHDLKLPNSCSQMRFTNSNKKCNLTVSHSLKVLMRIERGDDKELDPKTGRRKQFDIVVQTPIQILSCRCKPEWMSLPGYSESFQGNPEMSSTCPCGTKRPTNALSRLSTINLNTTTVDSPTSGNEEAPRPPLFIPIPPSPLSSQRPRIGGSYEPPASHRLYASPSASESEFGVEASPGRSSAGVAAGTQSSWQVQQGSALDTLRYRNELFERLVAGRVSESGEPPPAYGSFTESARALVQ